MQNCSRFGGAATRHSSAASTYRPISSVPLSAHQPAYRCNHRLIPPFLHQPVYRTPICSILPTLIISPFMIYRSAHLLIPRSSFRTAAHLSLRPLLNSSFHISTRLLLSAYPPIISLLAFLLSAFLHQPLLLSYYRPVPLPSISPFCSPIISQYLFPPSASSALLLSASPSSLHQPLLLSYYQPVALPLISLFCFPIIR